MSAKKVLEVGEKTYRIQVQVMTYTSTIYLIDERPGILIDPGPSATIPAIEEAMALLGMKDLNYIIPTHMHMDHGGAAGSLAHRFSQARVALHPRAFRRSVDPTRVIEGTKRVFGEDFADHFGPILPVPEAQAMVVADGQRIATGSRELEIVFAPGHNDDHIAILDHRTRGLFSGEALGAPTKAAPTTPLPFAAPPRFDLDAYLETIAKLGALDPALIFYAHDGVGRNPRALIAVVTETTKLVGALVEEALARDMAPPVITRLVQEHFATRFGVKEEEIDVGLTVAGYIQHFQNKKKEEGK